LARAALALDEDGGRALTHLLDQLHHLLHRRARPDEAGDVELRRRTRVLGGELQPAGPRLPGAADGTLELRPGERLRQEVAGAGAHPFHGDLHTAIGAHEDELDLGMRGARETDEL